MEDRLTTEDYQIAKSNGISANNASNRFYDLFWSKERAITEPVKKRVWKDERAPYRKRAVENGISKNTFNQRVHLGWDYERACTEPVQSVEDKMKVLIEKNRKKGTVEV